MKIRDVNIQPFEVSYHEAMFHNNLFKDSKETLECLQKQISQYTIRDLSVIQYMRAQIACLTYEEYIDRLEVKKFDPFIEVHHEPLSLRSNDLSVSTDHFVINPFTKDDFCLKGYTYLCLLYDPVHWSSINIPQFKELYKKKQEYMAKISMFNCLVVPTINTKLYPIKYEVQLENHMAQNLLYVYGGKFYDFAKALTTISNILSSFNIKHRQTPNNDFVLDFDSWNIA